MNMPQSIARISRLLSGQYSSAQSSHVIYLHLEPGLQNVGGLPDNVSMQVIETNDLKGSDWVSCN